ncbi:MAG TPA: DoxX family membrane protein [Bryobacteraceae bacterium]|nr:DoxX family membrane protein [Bryobacteraceae bacterium]
MPRFSLLTFARTFLAFGLIGLGVLSLGSGDFALNWQPVPNGLPLHEILARLSGVLLVAGGFGLLIRRLATRSALAVSAYWLLCAGVMHFIRAVEHPFNIGSWLGLAENMLLVCGAYVLYRLLAGMSPPFPVVARVLLGLGCVVCGLSHFRFAGVTADMIPAWLPGHIFFALFTGTCHIAAGLAIIAGVLPRLAATLEAAMITLFVLLVHVPAVVHAPLGRLQWTMVFIASAMAACVWAVAASLETAPFFGQAEARAPLVLSAPESRGTS